MIATADFCDGDGDGDGDGAGHSFQRDVTNNY